MFPTTAPWKMANDIANAILEELPTSSVWLVVYRQYSHEEGMMVRKCDNGFYFKHFGSEGCRVHYMAICDAPETYCCALNDAAVHLWTLANVLHQDNRGLELAYMPRVCEEKTVWRIHTAATDSKEDFVAQVTPLLETLESVCM